jgi:MerR family transcriptional regulator/heat shock protein HspR
MYEREGLIIPHKSKGNQRLYTFVDIERIVSIRKNMKELKLSINSIRMLLSTVPCYRIINCSEEDRKNCAAYHEGIKPCWSFKHEGNICESIECKECEVYINHYDYISTYKTLKKML